MNFHGLRLGDRRDPALAYLATAAVVNGVVAMVVFTASALRARAVACS